MIKSAPPPVSAHSERLSPSVSISQSISSWVIYGSWSLLGTVILFSLSSPELPAWLLYAPFIISFVCIGLPHGAADHWVLTTIKNRRFTLPNIIRVIIPYLALAIAYMALWLLAPPLSFVLFILMTWYHWGQGDLYSLFMYTGHRHLRTRVHFALAIFIRGALPMLIPLLFFPDIYRSVAADIISILSEGGIANLDFFFSDAFRLFIGAGMFLCICFYFASSFQRTNAWLHDLAEVTLLTLFFSLVHPVFAIGVYFCFWHGVRHIARILLLQNKETPSNKKSDITQFTIHAAPTTIAALALLGAMYLLVPNRPETIQEFTGLYLILISVLTLPHVWVVFKMDQQEKVWEAPFKSR